MLKKTCLCDEIIIRQISNLPFYEREIFRGSFVDFQAIAPGLLSKLSDSYFMSFHPVDEVYRVNGRLRVVSKYSLTFDVLFVKEVCSNA